MSRHHIHLNVHRWARIRCQVLDRDGWRCRACGRAGRLECDHVRPLERGGDPYDITNLQTLCRSCHIAKTRREAEEAGRAVPGRSAWVEMISEIDRND